MVGTYQYDGSLALGNLMNAAEPAKVPAPRKEDYVYYVR